LIVYYVNSFVGGEGGEKRGEGKRKGARQKEKKTKETKEGGKQKGEEKGGGGSVFLFILMVSKRCMTGLRSCGGDQLIIELGAD